jgi:pimeloyl-ACP methyl ester carboxylesterase
MRQVEAGAGEPAVVLEAGLNGVAESWQRVMPLLAAHVRVVAYDRAGLGGSAPAPGLATIDRQIDDLTSVITGLAAGPCVLAGHSWGGILVQLLAFRRPDLAQGLVLVDPGHEELESLLPLPLQWGWRVMRAVFPDELHDDAPVTTAALRELRAAAKALSRRARRRHERFPRFPPPVPRALDAPAGRARRGGPARTPCRRRRHRPSNPHGPARRRGRHDPHGSHPDAAHRGCPGRLPGPVPCISTLEHAVACEEELGGSPNPKEGR